MRRLLPLLLLISLPARAEFVNTGFITELGVGYKLPQSTSYVLLPECNTVSVLGVDRSCGGDNPTFAGWPIAWEAEFGSNARFRIRAGWFHLSHWFDGGGGREVHSDMALVSLTIKWSKN